MPLVTLISVYSGTDTNEIEPARGLFPLGVLKVSRGYIPDLER